MCLIILVVLYLIAAPELFLFDGVYMEAKKSETRQLLSLLLPRDLFLLLPPFIFLTPFLFAFATTAANLFHQKNQSS
jgi:hypothetical protein